MRALLMMLLALAACQTRQRPILLYNGTGTSPNDVAAVEAILNANRFDYATADASQLNEMNDARLKSYRLLIFPGGNFHVIAKNFKPGTTAKVRAAVQGGVSYLGICAGGFLAGNSSHDTFNLTSGVEFDFYADLKRGIRKTVVAIAGPGTPTLDQYWEDGPQFSGWGEVVGKYPDGTPAMVQGESGRGWVILSGVHAEAPASWRDGMTFTTPISADHAYAATLVRAALDRTRLPHY
jgi:glutamine amidotransferase-like uncharacterized protein